MSQIINKDNLTILLLNTFIHHNIIKPQQSILFNSVNNSLLLQMLHSIFNSQPPSQIPSKDKQLPNYLPHHKSIKHKLLNPHNKSTLIHKHSIVPNPTNNLQITHSSFLLNHSQNSSYLQQNQLRQIKKYSHALDKSTTLSKIQTNSNSTSSAHNHQTPTKQASLAQPLKQTQLTQPPQQTQKVYDHYALKNQRKIKVLAKAKQLGVNNFYKFLKQTSIIVANKHNHRLYSQTKQEQKVQLFSNQKLKKLSPQIITPIVVSFEPIKSELLSVVQRKKNIELPRLIQKQLKQRIKQKTQPQQLQNSFLYISKDGSSVSLKKNKSRKKQLIRSLTQINEKIRQNRKQNKQKNKLLFNNEQVKDNRTFIQKWKYKSLFDQSQICPFISQVRGDQNKVTDQNNKLDNKLVRSNTQVKANKQEKQQNKQQLQRLRQEIRLRNKIKLLKISRSNILNKQHSNLSMSRNSSFNSKHRNLNHKIIK